jgi:hypothetical protein
MREPIAPGGADYSMRPRTHLASLDRPQTLTAEGRARDRGERVNLDDDRI